MAEVRLTAPLSQEDVEKLNIGDTVILSGVIYTGRDAAHKLMVDALDEGKELPFPVDGSVIYYVGPAPTKPGNAIGSAGPTTSYRMDPYAPRLLDLGMKMMIGKGKRDAEVVESCIKNKAVYCAAVGGAAALIAKQITKAEVISYDELGPEAVRRLEIKDFPCIVINDTKGNDLYKEGRAKFAK
jgi:fumarate hydratase subunit beta